MCIYICTSSWLSFFLSLNVCMSIQLYYYSFYVYMSVSWSVFLSSALNFCISVQRFYYSFYVYMYVSWSMFVSISEYLHLCPVIIVCLYVRPLIHPRFSFFLWIHVFGYIYICKSFDPYISVFLSECLNQCPAILSFIMCVYVGLLICVSLFVSECICVWLNYFTHCTCIYIYMYVSWFIHVSFTHCLWMSVSVSSYVITHCMCRYMSPEPCFSHWMC